MKKFITFILAFVMIFSTVFLNSCSEFFDALNSALENLDYTEDETKATTVEDVSLQTEIQNNTIPYLSTPQISEYYIKNEIFYDDIEREASEIIDSAIKKALAYITVMKDDRHSSVSYPFEEDANGYLSLLTKDELEIYNKLATAGRSFNNLTINSNETKTDLNKCSFNIHSAFTFVDPVLNSYYYYNTAIGINMDYQTYAKSISSEYHDPYKDMTAITSSKVEMEKLQHDISLLEHIVKRIVKFMPENLSAYDKYYYLAAVLSEHVIFTGRPENSDTAFGALVCGKAVCEGYAKAYLLLCKEANLYCAYRTGQPDGMHIWNMVKLDSGIYNVDVTWCDVTEAINIRWYDNFMKSDTEFSDHNITTGVKGTGSYEPSPYEQ